LEYRIRVGKRLELELVTRNRGRDPFVLGCALHTYFSVSDVRKVKVLGLEGTRYVDKVHGAVNVQEGALTFASEVDRIYLDTTASCVIQDPGMNRSIRVEKAGSRSTVVWNPWIEKSERLGDMGKEGYLGMLCVETCNADEDVVTVPPSGEHRLKAVYSLCDLSIL
ncbi:MAG TPA: D-hexose-6-phosphate mutarotase, partial [Burkholderiales bacterium]|nr:D-hexose-6-phosphate mutarotase [Burkholderiales bacterium]